MPSMVTPLAATTSTPLSVLSGPRTPSPVTPALAPRMITALFSVTVPL